MNDTKAYGDKPRIGEAMRCGECKFWRAESRDFGRCAETCLPCYIVQGETCSIAERKEPENPKLRDGDCFIGENGITYVQVADKIRMANTNKVLYDTYVVNLLDLSAAVQRGQKIVMLTNAEAMKIMSFWH
jgi:hypothetical protein